MPGSGFERFGLTANPFRELAGDPADDPAVLHVSQETDPSVRTLRDEVLDKEARAIVAILGGHGAGKTEQLRVARAAGLERKAFVVYFDILETAASAVRGLAAEFPHAAKAKGLGGFLGAPAWLRPVGAVAKESKSGIDPFRAGKVLGEALNAAAPSMLLLNDLHHLVRREEATIFLRMLEATADVAAPGVLLMFTCLPDYYEWIGQHHPSLVSRINRTVVLPALTDREAGLLLAKRMLPKRIVEDLDPTYPFDAEAVSALNTAAQGNPRRLLAFADRTLESAVRQHVYRIDLEVAGGAVKDTSPWSEGTGSPTSSAETPSVEPVRPAAPRAAG